MTKPVVLIILSPNCGYVQELHLTTATDLDGGWQLPSGVSQQTASDVANSEPVALQTDLQDVHFENTHLARGSNILQDDAGVAPQLLQPDALHKGKVPALAAVGPLDFWATPKIEIVMDSNSPNHVPSAATPGFREQRSHIQHSTASEGLASHGQAIAQHAKDPQQSVVTSVKQQAAAAGHKHVSTQHKAGFATDAAIDFGLADEAFKRAEIKIRLNPGAMDADMSSAYHQAAKQHMYDGVISTAVPQKLQSPADQQQKCSYQSLLETDELTKFTQQVVNELRVYFERFHEHTLQQQQLEWVLMVDNSGSMSSKRTQTAEALVLAIETLRRLECRFAVWRFGNRGESGRMPLKLLNAPFTYLTGQKILESFSYNEGTYPATNFRAIACQTWGTDRPEATDLVRKHRIVLMVYDGLTQERHAEDYINTAKQYDVNLCVLNITDNKEDVVMEEMRKVLHDITFNSYEVVNVSAIHQLPMAMAVIMTRQFDRVLTKMKVCFFHRILPALMLLACCFADIQVAVKHTHHVGDAMLIVLFSLRPQVPTN